MLTSEVASARIAVVGSVFLDLLYDRPFTGPGAEPEPIRSFHGGIARNIAENLGWHGLRPRLITLLTPNAMGDEVAAELLHAGVDVFAKHANPGIGVYRAFVRSSEIEEYRIEQPLIEQLDWPFVRTHLRSATHVVIETGLDPAMTRDLLRECKTRSVPVYGVPTRLHDIPIDDHLTTISTMNCVLMNRVEAETLLRRQLPDGDAAARAVGDLQRLGVGEVVITLGAAGVVAAARDQAAAMFPAPAIDVVSTLGCGDAFTAGFVAASSSRQPFASAIEVALELARRTAATPGPVCGSAELSSESGVARGV